MCVHRKRRHPKGLRHHHARRLVTDTGQRLEFGEGARNHAAMTLDQKLAHALEVARLRGRETTGADDLEDLRDLHGRQIGCSRRPPKKLRRDQVNPHIGGLRRQGNRHEQREGITMSKRNRRLRVETVEDSVDFRSLQSSTHRPHHSDSCEIERP